MIQPFFLILKTDIKKIGVDLKREKISSLLGLLFKVFLLIVLYMTGWAVNITLPLDLSNYFLLLLLTVDWIFKYLAMKVSFLNIGFLIPLVSKRYISLYALMKMIFSFYSICFPFLFLGYGQFDLFVVSLLVSIFNSFSVFVVKNFSKLNALLPIVLYMGFYFLGTDLRYGQFAIPALLICVIYIYVSYRIIYKNIYAEWEGRSRLIKLLSSKINRLFHTLFFNELLLYVRNKRTRIFFVQGVLLFLVGFLYLYQESITEALYQFEIALLFTGAFLLTFWQFFLALDSSYFPFLLTQSNIYEVLKGKVNFMYAVLTVSFLICYIISMIYFPDKYLFVLAAYLYNIGINLKIMLWYGFYNRSRIELNKSPLFNYESVNQFQFFAPVVLFLTSGFVFMIFLAVFSTTNALLGISGLGTTGLLFNKPFLQYGSRTLNEAKYRLLVSFHARF
ncbi:DUF5687 family protein [Aliifodinibius sp. S!AR15-10]|uniref:DUF5687 family protein n=1 Tax=Aliifodinibius sp. S!AR15-10 TaxID=2950437 RepID=UPI00285A39F8|nr:DUF5687 family protein [Aliifodinibius sp. S!AR15-10]MDR8393093.1 DUF5687 family protein [Aliifodinibius sp. S!AR15-10]